MSVDNISRFTFDDSVYNSKHNLKKEKEEVFVGIQTVDGATVNTVGFRSKENVGNAFSRFFRFEKNAQLVASNKALTAGDFVDNVASDIINKFEDKQKRNEAIDNFEHNFFSQINPAYEKGNGTNGILNKLSKLAEKIVKYFQSQPVFRHIYTTFSPKEDYMAAIRAKVDFVPEGQREFDFSKVLIDPNTGKVNIPASQPITGEMVDNETGKRVTISFSGTFGLDPSTIKTGADGAPLLTWETHAEEVEESDGKGGVRKKQIYVLDRDFTVGNSTINLKFQSDGKNNDAMLKPMSVTKDNGQVVDCDIVVKTIHADGKTELRNIFTMTSNRPVLAGYDMQMGPNGPVQVPRFAVQQSHAETAKPVVLQSGAKHMIWETNNPASLYNPLTFEVKVDSVFANNNKVEEVTA